MKYFSPETQWDSLFVDTSFTGILKDCQKISLKIFEKLNKDSKHNLIAEIYGTTAIEIVNTIIKNKYISSLQHAADMGIELQKAEIALKNNIDYIQDKDLVF